MIDKIIKANIKKSISRIQGKRLNTTAVLLACCFIDGLGRKLFDGGSEYSFKKYVELYMPASFKSLETRSLKLAKKKDYCLHSLWRDIRCGLVHEIDPKSPAVVLGRGKSIAHQNVSDKRFTGRDLVISSPKFIEDFLTSLASI